MPVALVMGLLSIVAIMGLLSYLAIIKSEQRDEEKKRADALQHSVDVLEKQTAAIQDRTQENQKFFETVRQLIIAQNANDRQKLIDQLKGLQFGTTTIDTVPPKATTTTSTTTSVSSTTSAPPRPETTTTTRAPPSTTTTARPPPTTFVCVTTPSVKVCS